LAKQPKITMVGQSKRGQRPSKREELRT